MEKDWVIIISDEKDGSTRLVSAYLDYFGVKFKILKPVASIENVSSYEKMLNGCNGIWLRRGNLKLSTNNSSLRGEDSTLIRYLHFMAESNPNSIGNLQKEYEHNKLIDLKMAKKVGLKIPDSYIITSKKKIIEIT